MPTIEASSCREDAGSVHVDDVLGIVYLVAHKQTVVAVFWCKIPRHKESGKAVNDFRFHIAVGIVAHQACLVQVIGCLDNGFLYRAVALEEEMSVVLTLGKGRKRVEHLGVVFYQLFYRMLWNHYAQQVE